MGNLYFASDFHLGVPDLKQSRLREDKLVRWLESIATDAEEIFLVGDVFDFWFEYRYVIPKGFTRLLGCLARMSDSGIRIHFFKGNHDMWMFGYFEQELGATVHSNEYVFEKNGKTFFVHHGDGLGFGDEKYKILKKIFRSPLCQKAFGFLHPYVGIGLANYFSRSSRAAQMTLENENIDTEKEWLVQFCRETLKHQYYDYMIFGHRHLALDLKVGEQTRYINLGDWFTHNTYAKFDGNDLALMKFEAR